MRRSITICTAAALSLLTILPGAARTHNAPVAFAAGAFVPRFGAEPLGASLQPGATTIPTWSDSFSSNGTAYPYRMVGTDPASGSATTTTPTEIIPLRFVFSDGTVFDGSTKVDLAVQSPIFQAARFKSGTTQYGDAMQRANFWNDISTASSDWHVLLGQPTVLATQTIAVPANQGSTLPAPTSGEPIGAVDQQWFSAKLQNLMSSLKVDATTLPIFLTYDTFPTITGGGCCLIGYHGASSVSSGGTSAGSANGNGSQQINTYIFASYMDPGIFPMPFDAIQDVSALSHEAAEWLNDPFAQNTVPSWTTSLTGQYYGCSNLLEVGDPLVSIDFPVKMPNGVTYHPQDEAFLPWFERTATSSSLDGKYTYLGTYTTYSPSC